LYLNLIIEGIILGATLAILLGPIFVTITQIALQKGARAGIVASTGIWVSDILIVGVSYFFIQSISDLVNNAGFTHWLGLLGGLILISFGIGALVKKAEINFSNTKHTTNDYIGFWTKGFLVNTVNPFTFIFWLGVISTYVISKKITDLEALVFFSTIILVIMITDTAKVFLAKMIRNKLTQKHFDTFSKVAGIGLIIFGIVLLVRSQTI